MLDVSTDWKIALGNYLNSNRPYLTPETSVKLKYNFGDTEAVEYATASATSTASWASVSNILDTTYEIGDVVNVATFEPNNFVLDGEQIIYGGEPVYNVGWISGEACGANKQFTTSPVITINFSQTITEALPGLTISWSPILNQYATDYNVAVYNRNNIELFAEHIVDNTSNISNVPIGVNNYNRIVLTINKWSVASYRARIENIKLGLEVVFTKEHLISFKHTQDGDLNSFTLPQNKIEFSINNTDKKFNPDNPSGIYGYLAENQKVEVYYGSNYPVEETIMNLMPNNINSYSQVNQTGHINTITNRFEFDDLAYNGELAVFRKYSLITLNTYNYLGYTIKARRAVSTGSADNGFKVKFVGITLDDERFDLIDKTYTPQELLDGVEFHQVILNTDYEWYNIYFDANYFSRLEDVEILPMVIPMSYETTQPKSVGLYQRVVDKRMVNEWHLAGTFNSTGWETPQNGLTASFTAGSQLEFMDQPLYIEDLAGLKCSGRITFYDLVKDCFVKDGGAYEIDDNLKDMNYYVDRGDEIEYTEVASIGGDGSHIIDLDITDVNGFEIGVQNTGTGPTINDIFGSEELGPYGDMYVYENHGYVAVPPYTARLSSSSDNNLHIIKAGEFNGWQTMYDGTTKATTTDTFTRVERPLYVFDKNNGYNSPSTGVNITYIKLYKANTCVMDLVPAVRNKDSKAGMFDKKTGLFYTSEGTNTFVVGASTGTTLKGNELVFSNTCAGTLQLSANATRSIIRIDETDKVHIEQLPLEPELSDYTIDLFSSYSFPEYQLSKPLKKIVYNNRTYEVLVGSEGEEQQISNAFIQSSSDAIYNASWISGILNTRKTISGEYRSDPRAQVYDYIKNVNKYATNEIYLTNITYNYNGCFKASYEGRVMKSLTTKAMYGDVYAGEINAGGAY